MRKELCDSCGKAVESCDESLRIYCSENEASSWMTYGTLTFCEECVEKDSTLKMISEKLN